MRLPRSPLFVSIILGLVLGSTFVTFADTGSEGNTDDEVVPTPGMVITNDENVTHVHQREASPTDTAPKADVTISSSSVVAGEPVTFDASGSTDESGRTLAYRWDLAARAGPMSRRSNAIRPNRPRATTRWSSTRSSRRRSGSSVSTSIPHRPGSTSD